MAVGSIYTAKDNRSGFQPLVLVSIVWPDGTILRYSTHDLTGASAFGGFNWQPRILNAPMAAQQAISDTGVDIPPTLDLKLADPDGAIWATVKTKGLLSATVIATFVIYDVATKTFSSDTYTPFVGRANPPSEIAFDSLSFTAESKLNMQRKFIPTAQIQRLCLWDFPATLADRQKAAGPSDGSGICRCGYSADVGGGIGNLDPGTGLAFVVCGKTRGDCLARMGNPTTNHIDHDGSGRQTGTFSGIQYDPQSHYWSKGYVSGQWEFGINNLNQGKYSQPVPLAYGLVKAAPPTTVVTTGDANLTATESILTLDQLGPIQQVVMNDVVIFPSGGGGTVIAGFYNLVNDGSRLGRSNPDTLFDGVSDSYGSIAAIHIRVPKTLQDASSSGSIQVLFQGRKVRVYSQGAAVSIAGVSYGALTTIHAFGHGLTTGDIVQISGCVGDSALNDQFVVTVVDADYFTLPATTLRLGTWTGGGSFYKWTWSLQFSDNPVWVLIDLLWWADFNYSEIRLLPAFNAAAYCDVQIPYKTVWGAMSTHARFRCSLYINQRRGAAELIRAFRLGFRCMLAPSANGLLQIDIEKTLAEQQSAPVLGSNYNVASPSVLADGTAANGYYAYDFNDSNILNKDGKKEGPPSLRFYGMKRQDMPNKLSAAIQDVENQNSIDSYTVNCVQAENLMGEEIATQFGAEGINTYDQAQRVFGLQFAKTFLGNYTSDYTGSLYAEWQAGPWALHLKIGDIVRLSSTQKNVPATAIRITKKVPDLNFRFITLTGRFHNDAWYEDAYEQNPGKNASTLANAALLRPPYAWRANVANPAAGDPMWSSSEGFFGISLSYGSDAAGNPTPVITLMGTNPVNLFTSSTQPPYVPLQGTTANVGGTIPGGVTVFIGIAAKDTVGATFKVTQVSTLAQVTVPGGTNTNTVTVSGIHFMPGSAGHVLVAGLDPSALTVQYAADTTPASVTIAGLIVGGPPPDVQADHLLARVWRVEHAGPIGVALSGVTAVTSNTLQSAGVLWDVNQWAGYDCSIIGFVDDPAAVPIANFRIASNTSDTLTLAAGSPDPTAMSIQSGDVLTIRGKPSAWGPDFYTDPGWNNSLAYNQQIALQAAPSGGLTVVTWNAHGLATGARVRIDNGADLTGIWTVTVIDANTFSLNGGPASTTYVSGGFVAILTGGLIPSAERGKLLVAIAGTGRGMWNRIRDNNQLTIWVEGKFAVQPDSTTRFIVVRPDAVAEQPTSHTDCSTLSTVSTITVPIPNDKDQPLAVAVSVVASDGTESFEYLAQVREIYSYGAPAGLITPNRGV